MVKFSWRHWLDAAQALTVRLKGRKRPTAKMLRVEGLEDRALLTANLPFAVDDSAYVVAEDQTLNGTSVLGNDTDDDGDTIDEALLGTNVSNGQLTLNLDGSFTYTPNPNFHGVDSFTYFARDSANNETSASAATVTITVNSIADLTATDDSFGTDEDTLLSDSVAGNDSTTSGGTLAYALQSQAGNGAAVVNSDGTFTYQPNPNFHGSDSFTYTVTDASANETATRTVTITVNSVNDAPLANNDSFETDEDAVYNGTLTGSDPDGDTFTYVLGTQANHGTAVVNADGTFTYTPAANFHGTDSFTFKTNDGFADSAEATVTVTIHSVADLTATDDSFMIDEDVLLSDNVASNDSTTSGGALTYALDTQASHGTAAVNSDGTFTYQPDPNFSGTDSFTYEVTDAAANETAIRTVTVTIASIADLTALDDSFTVDEDASVTDSVASNDSTTSGGALTFALTNQAVNGLAAVNANGSFTYTPFPNFHGTDTFTYTVTDSDGNESATRTVTITVAAIADLTANDDAFSTQEDVLVSDSVATNDSTISGGTLVYALDTQAAHGTATVNPDGTFTYQPESNYHGSDTFTYLVTDADANETAIRTVTITISAVNDSPVADNSSFSTDEDTLYSGTLTGSDPESDPLTFALGTQASHGIVVINADGTFTYTPAANFHGTDSFTFKTNDGFNDSAEATVSITVNSISDLVANNDSVSTDEDFEVTGSVATNDSTTSGGQLVYSLGSQATGGVAVVNADGSFTYHPGANFFGTDTFTYTVTDATANETAVRTVTITVNAITDLTATDDSFTTPEDSELSGSVAGNDSTTSGGTLTYSFSSQAAHGTATVNADGTFTYIPNANYAGTDSFSYLVTDELSEETAVRTVSITIDAVNDAPTAEAGSFATNEDTPYQGTLVGHDVDGDAITFALASQAAHGVAVVNADGTFTYTPAANYHGTDSFTFKTNDGTGDSVEATVTIVINAVADLTAVDDSATGNEDTLLTGTVATNDSTTSGGQLAYALDTQASHGTVVVNADGSFSYQPELNFHGTDSFTYAVSDATSDEWAIQTVTITINAVADLTAADDAFSVDEDTQLSNTVSTNDSTTSGGTLAYALGSQATNGVAVVNADGTFTYQPNLNFQGTDSFTYTVTDAASGESDVRTVTITVNAVNDAPAGDAASFATDEDTPYSGTLTGSDLEGDSLTFALGTQAVHGTVTVNTDGTFTYTPALNFNGSDSFTFVVSDGSNDSEPVTVTITVNPVNDAPVGTASSFTTGIGVQYNGTLAGTDVDNDPLTFALGTQATNGTVTVNADGTFTYVPNTGYQGTDSFTFTVGDGTLTSAETTVTVTINSIPVGNAQAVSVNEDSQVSGTLTGSDGDGDAITFVLGTQAANGTATVNADGTFTYVPNADFHGTDTFTFVVNDGLSNSIPAVVTVTVAPVNDAPVATAAQITTNEDTPYTGTLTAVDIDGDTLTYTLDTQATNGVVTVNADGTFTYVPDANFHGADSFTFHVNDGTVDSAIVTVNITVVSVNDVPVGTAVSISTNEDTNFSGTLGATDADGETLTFALGTQAAHGTVTVNADGTYTYVPNAQYHGTDAFTFTVTDGTATSEPTTVTITVVSVNDVPVADSSSFTINEDATYSGTLTGTDIDGDTLAYLLGTQATNGTATINPDGSFTYVPNANFHGSDSFTFRISDGTGFSDFATVTITVNAVQDAPTTSNGNGTSPEGGFLLSSVSPLGSDVDGDALTYVVVSQPQHGTLQLSPDGTFTYTPNPGYSGPDSFTFKANDGQADSNVSTFSITVTLVDDPLELDLGDDAPNVPRTSTKVQIAPNASVSDPDSEVNYSNARIRVAITEGGTALDASRNRVRLSVQNQGTGANLVKVKGTKIYFDGSRTSVAKITGGKKGSPLVITFTAGASEAAVNAVLKQLSIQASKKAAPGPRTIGIEVTASGQTAQATQVVTIS